VAGSGGEEKAVAGGGGEEKAAAKKVSMAAMHGGCGAKEAREQEADWRKKKEAQL